MAHPKPRRQISLRPEKCCRREDLRHSVLCLVIKQLSLNQTKSSHNTDFIIFIFMFTHVLLVSSHCREKMRFSALIANTISNTMCLKIAVTHLNLALLIPRSINGILHKHSV